MCRVNNGVFRPTFIQAPYITKSKTDARHLYLARTKPEVVCVDRIDACATGKGVLRDKASCRGGWVITRSKGCSLPGRENILSIISLCISRLFFVDNDDFDYLNDTGVDWK